VLFMEQRDAGEGATAEHRAAAKLQSLIRLQTVSYDDEHRIAHDAFHAMHTELELLFPLLHLRLEKTVIERHSLVFHWKGRSDSRPIVLMAHQDVVPVDDSMPWTHPAFGGIIEDGVIWGRGTLDDKGALVAICEAVERLLEQDFTPAQDVWLCLGAREEVSGPDAKAMVDHLRSKGVEPWFVLDEGGAIAHDAFPGVKPPLGVVGVSEKGTTTLLLRAESKGGHSSTPSAKGPTWRIARAVMRLEKAPFPARLPATTIEMFRRMGPHAPAPLRPLLAHGDRLAAALTKVLQAAGPEPAAMTRTTMAVTMLEGSPANNVIASSATAAVNLRILVGDTVASATAHVRKAIRDKHITIEAIDSNEPSPLSPVDDEAFGLIESTIAEVFPDAVPTPYIMMAATDSRFFTTICDRVYRFAPFRMTKAQREAIHSYDEHLHVHDLADGVTWFERLIEGLPA
jgi:carboxypeptidase PM20D1